MAISSALASPVRIQLRVPRLHGKCCLLPLPSADAHASVNALSTRSMSAVSLRSRLALPSFRIGALVDAPERVSLRIHVATRAGKTEGESAEVEKEENVPFGYTRKDVILIGVGITLFGFVLKYGLELAGLDPLQSGNVVQITLVLGLMLGWVGTYLFRVGGKDMTYVKQLKQYEEAVMQKRLEELPDTELERLLAEVEEDKRKLDQKRKGPL